MYADLGYYALRLIVQALTFKDPVAALKAGLYVGNSKFAFDEHNVSHTIVQEVYGVSKDVVVRYP